MKLLMRCFFLLSLCLCNLSFGQSTDKIKTELQKQFGAKVQIKSINPSPIPGLYEVIANSSIIYVDAQAKFLIQGSITDLKTGTNLTDAREDEINRIQFSDLPFLDAVKLVRGDGSRKMAVFADPNCGYCKTLEKTFQNMENITVYTFLTPILSADSTIKSKAVWCSNDPSKAWVNWMTAQTPLPNKTDCPNPLEKNLVLAKKLGVTGTPAIFFADGSRIPGAASKDDLEKRLAYINKNIVK